MCLINCIQLEQKEDNIRQLRSDLESLQRQQKESLSKVCLSSLVLSTGLVYFSSLMLLKVVATTCMPLAVSCYIVLLCEQLHARDEAIQRLGDEICRLRSQHQEKRIEVIFYA